MTIHIFFGLYRTITNTHTHWFVISSELFCDQVHTPFVAFELVCRQAQWFCVLLGMSNITLRMIFCFGMVECEDLRYGRKLET